MKTVTVPDWGNSDSLYMQVQVPKPGDPGYTGGKLPETDPWASYVNPVIEAAGEYADYQAWSLAAGYEVEPEAGDG